MLTYVGVEEDAFEFGLGLLHLGLALAAALLLEALGVVLLVGVGEALEHLHAALVVGVEEVGRRHDFP